MESYVQLLHEYCLDPSSCHLSDVCQSYDEPYEYEKTRIEL